MTTLECDLRTTTLELRNFAAEVDIGQQSSQELNELHEQIASSLGPPPGDPYCVRLERRPRITQRPAVDEIVANAFMITLSQARQRTRRAPTVRETWTTTLRWRWRDGFGRLERSLSSIRLGRNLPASTSRARQPVRSATDTSP